MNLFRKKESDVERFCRAMDGEWVVTHYELENDLLQVHYRSVLLPDVTWSHRPFDFDVVAPVGTIGRISFAWKRP